MNRPRQIALYVIADLISAMSAWAAFYAYRKSVIEAALFGIDLPFEPDTNFYLGISVLPIAWVVLYALTGTYNDIFRKSRLKEFGQTLYLSVIGVVVIFFSLLLDDVIVSYKSYYAAFAVLLSLQFGFTAVARFILTTITARKSKAGKWVSPPL